MNKINFDRWEAYIKLNDKPGTIKDALKKAVEMGRRSKKPPISLIETRSTSTL